MVTCSACSVLSVDFLRNIDHNEPYQHHGSVGDLKACAEMPETGRCGICALLWRTMDDLTQLDSSKPAIRDHPEEIYGLYGQFYDDFDFKFGEPQSSGGLPSYESAVKIEAKFLTFNLGLTRPGIRVFALEDTPAAHHFTERCTYVDPSQSLSMRLGRKWLDICREHHEKCRPLATSMPTRVIDLGSPDSLPGTKTRLLLSDGLSHPYVALSYCWGRGAAASLMLRDENFESMQQGIEENSLAKTYREAFSTTRELGFRYIWIDALCIIQGNKDDWVHESARMGQVYGNATLSIMASRSSDSANGFLQTDFKPATDPCPFPYGRYDENGHQIDGLYVCLDRAWFKETIDIDPVETRGWCLQEAELSKRQLVFGREGVSFQCKSSNFFEDEIWKFYHKRDVEPKGTSSHVGQSRRPPEELELLNHWYVGILKDYTSRALTNPSDVFAAISSLAVKAQQTIGGRYLAGLWESDLPRSLLWMPRYQTRWMVDTCKSETNLVPRHRPPQSQAPSWSWAALQGPVQQGWDYRKRWPAYPATNRPEEFLVRPASEDYTRWTSQDDCDAHILYMPYCELQIYGRIRLVKCTAIPQTKLLEWWKAQGPRIRFRPDHLPPQARGAIIFEPKGELGDEDISLLKDGCPFERAVAYGVFDIPEERVEEFWALPLTKKQGLILGRNDDGTSYRLGHLNILNYGWFAVGEEGLVRLV